MSAMIVAVCSKSPNDSPKLRHIQTSKKKKTHNEIMLRVLTGWLLNWKLHRKRKVVL